MVKLTADELHRIMNYKHNIRNMSGIAYDEDSNGLPTAHDSYSNNQGLGQRVPCGTPSAPRSYSTSSSSQQSSVANSPPRSHSASAGEEFFRQARSRLPYEQFSALLANIKELNALNQEETLQKVEEILGTENNDLYISFKGLLHSRC